MRPWQARKSRAVTATGNMAPRMQSSTPRAIHSSGTPSTTMFADGMTVGGCRVLVFLGLLGGARTQLTPVFMLELALPGE